MIAMPAPSERVASLLAQMSREEKIAQIVAFWDGDDDGGEDVAPLQGQQTAGGDIDAVLTHGIGHLTRVYGARPVDAAQRAAWLWQRQRDLVSNTRLGIPALVHEECLTGLAAWGAATFPAPLAWGATFNTEAVRQMAVSIGASMRELGIHQGLAPVLDVIRDPRWGRVEECIAEDPYLVGEIGTAYVQGLQSEGIHATLKHFVGYSASQSGRNFAPVHAGSRELEDIFLLPFEMAVKDGGVRSVMHSYAEIDGVPAAASQELLTGILRERWGFDGVVVADYFGVAFLHTLHGVAEDLGDAAGQALAAGVDIELPNGDAFLEPLTKALEAGTVSEELVDRAVIRALMQKEELGLLDATFADEPPAEVDLDNAEHRRLARQIADESVVLVSNNGTLPIEASTRVAVVGPNADRMAALFGCYSFVNHVLAHRPGVESRLEVATILDELRSELTVVGDAVAGCEVDGTDRSGIAAAVAAARDAEVAVVVVGDQAGLFGRGTVGEGCDRDDLELPGVQRELVEEVLATGTPTVVVLVSGRPYALDWAVDKAAAVVAAFFPGEEGASSIAGVLSGRINPSGRLPVSLPRSAGAQPFTYLHPRLGGDSDVTNLSSRPVAEFGHGLSYTSFEYGAVSVAQECPTDAPVVVSTSVRNDGEREGATIVQLYGHDRFASVTRPVAQLLGFARVTLAPGESCTVTFEVPPARLAFTGREHRRIVEPGALDLWVGTSAVREAEATTTLTGEVYALTQTDPRMTRVTVAREGSTDVA